MATTVPVGDGIPSAFYRNAIDLNRFSNSVSKKLVNSYNNVILKAVEQLEKIEKQPLSKQPAYKAARLRALIKQTKESLNTWAGGSVDELIAELEGVAKVQAGFIEEQLKKSMPRGMTEKISDQLGYAVNSVSISPSFAKAVVNTDPTALNLAVLRSDLAGAKAPKGTFKLTAKEGQTITLPNGNTVRKSFLGIAQAEAKRLNQVVRTGLLGGQTTAEIVRDLVGDLQKDQKGSLSKLLAQGGAATKSANGQVMTIVRTTVNQVTNTASQAVYKANPDVTEEYRYVATLDSRTSPVCRDLDGQIFKYNEGPVPPQHFGCRSTTVAVINYKKWGFTPPPAGKRASVDGPVPANTTYGKWLYDQRKPNTKFQAGSEQIAALGTTKAKYFNRLADKYGPDQALKKLIREDNTEVSLAQLQRRYGKPEDIKKTVKAKPKPKPKVEAFDVDKVYAEVTHTKNYEKNFLGGGEFGSAFKFDGGILKDGQIGQYEVIALEKLKGTGVAPKYLGGSFQGKLQNWQTEFVKTRKGRIAMTRAKGKTLDDILESQSFDDFSIELQDKKKKEMLQSYIKARKKMHLKGIAHNDLHEANFMYDFKSKEGTIIDFGLAQDNPKAALFEAIGAVTGNDSSGAGIMYDLLNYREYGKSRYTGNIGRYEKNVENVIKKLEKKGFDPQEEWQGWMSNSSIDMYTETNLTPDGETYKLTDKEAFSLLKEIYEGV